MSVSPDYMDTITAPEGDGTTVEDGIETVTTTAKRLPNWAGMAMIAGAVLLFALMAPEDEGAAEDDGD